MWTALQQRFVTVVVMVLDPAAHVVTVVNAGHTIPKLYSAAKKTLSDLVSVDIGGVPLGVEEKYDYLAVAVPLEAGDTVTVYTDGVTDAMNAAGITFGSRALEKCLTPLETNGSDAGRPKRVGEVLRTAVTTHANGRSQSDDIAVLCFGRWDPSADSNSTLNGQASGTDSRRE
jgi:serine phosphatase RsbU (regulator of sigma subunit)